jgi:hypothetical protein
LVNFQLAPDGNFAVERNVKTPPHRDRREGAFHGWWMPRPDHWWEWPKVVEEARRLLDSVIHIYKALAERNRSTNESAGSSRLRSVSCAPSLAWATVPQ